MTCKHCNQAIDAYTLEGKDLYCPICFVAINGDHKKDVMQLKQYRPARNYEPDEDWIPELIEQERQRKLRYEQEHRKDRADYFKMYHKQPTQEEDLFKTA